MWLRRNRGASGTRAIVRRPWVEKFLKLMPVQKSLKSCKLMSRVASTSVTSNLASCSVLPQRVAERWIRNVVYRPNLSGERDDVGGASDELERGRSVQTADDHRKGAVVIHPYE